MADKPTYEELEERLGELERQTCDYGQIKQEWLTLSHAVEQSPNAIIITDQNGLIEYVNPKFTEISGYTSEEASGMNASDIGFDPGYRRTGHYFLRGNDVDLCKGARITPVHFYGPGPDASPVCLLD
jgi:PAS domain-containing protein